VKPSPYNHFIPARDGIILAYNSYSGALAEIEPEHYGRVQELLADPGLSASAQDAEFVACLQAGGFLIPDGIDQFGALRSAAKQVRLGGVVLTLTIAPTLACNFACDYCFESRSAVTMSPEVQEALLRFAERQLVRSEMLRVCWFGGEPTLCLPLVERLQRQLLELAAKRRANVIPGSIISNGYLLDGAAAQRLKELGIERAQVTIDGPEGVHDARRKLRSGKGTFQRIIANLRETAGILDINVRINMDKENIDSACEVMALLDREGILPRVKVQFAQVRSTGAACSDTRDRCYTDEEFARTQVELYRQLLRRGIRQVEYPQALGGAGYCSALSETHYVVSPQGYLFRCWEELSTDPARSIGSLLQTAPEDYQAANAKSYRDWDPYALGECRACAVLPLCAGGCPLRAKEKRGEQRGECVTWKYNLPGMVAVSYEAQVQAPTGADQ